MLNFMKFLFIIIPFFSLHLYGKGRLEPGLNDNIQERKVYFHPENIQINRDGILVLMEDGSILSLRQLSFDGNGFYTSYSNAYTKLCKNCKFRNEATDTRCAVCGEKLK